jgi:hypothetical protein
VISKRYILNTELTLFIKTEKLVILAEFNINKLAWYFIRDIFYSFKKEINNKVLNIIKRRSLDNNNNFSGRENCRINLFSLNLLKKRGSRK